METLEQIKEDFDGRFSELQKAYDEAQEKYEQGEPEDREDLSKALSEVNEQVQTLTKERDERIKQHEWDSMKSELTTLQKALEEQRTANDIFSPLNPDEARDDAIYGRKGDKSFYADAQQLMKAALGGQSGPAEVRERWENSLGKAMTESVGSAGGFLVPPQISTELLELKEQTAILRPLFNSVSVSSNILKIASVESGLVAGWVAELAQKPLGDLTFAELSVETFTAAGLAVASNQLLRDSNPSIDRLINSDIARRLANLEEVAFIDGSGTNQPRGILNTAGVTVTDYTDGSGTAAKLINKIIDGVTTIYSTYFAAPNAILMHPRTWAYLIKAQESAAPSTYILGPPGGVGRRPNDPLPGYTGGQVPRGSIFGIDVYCTANMPITKGGGTESRVIIGNFNEGLILDHESVQLASSEHVYFTSNQTIFRAEEQLGFTAARYPTAFNVVAGTGLAGV